LTAELIVDGTVPSAPALSPDGRWVVFVLAPMGHAGEQPRAQLWATSTEGGQPRRLDIPPADLSAPRWASDSASFFFLSDGQLHRKPTDGPVRAVTNRNGAITGHQPLVDPQLVALIATEPDTKDDQSDVLIRGQEPPARLHLLDLRTGEISSPTSFSDRHVAEVTQRPDGGPLAVLTWSSPEIDPGLVNPALHLLDLDTGEVRNLGPVPAGANSPAWWQHGEDWHLSYLALTPPGLQAGNAVFDMVPDQPGRHRNLTSGMAACPVELVRNLVVVADGLDTAVHRISGDGDLTETTRVRGAIRQLSADRTGELAAVLLSTAVEPLNVYVGQLGGGFVRRTETRPELREFGWGAQERLSYESFDGLQLDGLLVLPPGQSRLEGPFPLVTVVHGGPYDRWADEFTLGWYPSAQWLAHAGYAVFLPNPRGGQGHGHEFAAGVVAAVGQEEWRDIRTGIDLLVAEGVADKDRLGIAGWSHGGFMAAWAVGHTDRFAAAVMGAGISDWGMQAGSGEWGSFETALAGSVGWEGHGPHRHDRLSPISYASSVRTPLLMVHGAEDTNVPLAQAEYFHRALRRFGAAHEFVVYPGENHSFRERDHQIDLLNRVRAWFDRWL
jgi:dipeptidyl aminopeptidase/acylaminoacyl peptidase